MKSFTTSMKLTMPDLPAYSPLPTLNSTYRQHRKGRSISTATFRINSHNPLCLKSPQQEEIQTGFRWPTDTWVTCQSTSRLSAMALVTEYHSELEKSREAA